MDSEANVLERCRLPLNGVLGPFTFRRNDRQPYWIVNGPVPLATALSLYEDPLGKAVVRVSGHAGCPPPEDPWITWTTRDGRRAWPTSEEGVARRMVERGMLSASSVEDVVFTDDRLDLIGTIDVYHIDTEAGLRLFADAIRSLTLAEVFHG